MTRIIRLCGIIIFCVFFVVGIRAYSADAQFYSVHASVDSSVSAPRSSISLSENETLADPENHPILMTVYLSDADGNALPDIKVVTNSSRGTIDIIELFSEDGQSVLASNSGKTDSNGTIKFRLSSYTPGNAIFSVLADSIINLSSQSVNFLPLPFPGNIEVTVTLPSAISRIIGRSSNEAKKIVLIPKAELQAPSTATRAEAKKVAIIGTELSIPFWIFVLLCILFVVLPILAVLNLYFVIKYRKHESREMKLLEQIAAAEHIDQVKYFVDNNHR